VSNLWQESDYAIDFGDVRDAAARVFHMVWRTTLGRPGFAVVRFPTPIDSLELRRRMLEIAESLPEDFVVERFGRFDQQVSSKFHRDGAPPASLLLLGYEATTVRSRIFIADASRAAIEAGIPLPEFVARFNPMFPAGEVRYVPFVTELELPHGEPYLVAINNSLLPYVPGPGNPLGVLHKAVIEAPDPAARRVINSVGLAPAGTVAGKSTEELRQFVSGNALD
jgi:hypothetical protein